MITKSGEVVEKLAKQYGCPIWEARDGTLTPLVLMGERHLRNAHRYVVGRRASYLLNQLIEENVDRLMASDWGEWDVSYATDGTAGVYLPNENELVTIDACRAELATAQTTALTRRTPPTINVPGAPQERRFLVLGDLEEW